MPDRFENPINQQEIWREKIVIKNIADFSSISISELEERTYQIMLQNTHENPKIENHYREKYGISRQDPIEDALRELIKTASVDFMSKLREKENECQQQIDYCISIANKYGYLQNEPAPLTVIISHNLLHQGSPFRPGKQYLNSYDPTNNAIIIDINLPSTIIAHEFGHALSTDNKKIRSGIKTLIWDEQNEDLITHGNEWLDEGLTVIWEQMTTLDNKNMPGRNKNGDPYNWYLQTTKLILTEINISPNDALKAYFGDETMLQLLRDKFFHRFNCSIEDLKHLGYKLDVEWTKKLITGQPIEETINKNTNQSVKKNLFKLSEIFPNLKINEENSESNVQRGHG
ncbi:MAG: hypothetical protein Q8P20_09820 [bacterium]|nr:hypothetical protein [bacterium]